MAGPRSRQSRAGQAVLVFAALAAVQGAFLAAFAGRPSRSLPLTFAFPRLLPWFLGVRASRGGVVTGRVLLVVAVLAALPAFVASVVSIVTR